MILLLFAKSQRCQVPSFKRVDEMSNEVEAGEESEDGWVAAGTPAVD
jgi:hypothetical protein